MHAVSNHNLPLSSQEIEDEIIWNSEASKEKHLKSSRKIDITQVFKADQFFRNDTIVKKTPLTEAKELSQQYGAKIYLKREDQQEGKTYKIRGAYYYYLNNKNGEKFKQKGFVTVSDGNFSTSVAILCGIFKFKATIFVPESCISHKLEKMKKVSHGYAEIIQTGTSFQHSEETAQKYAIDNNLDYVQPHESLSLFAGFATVAKQLLDEKKVSKIDYVLVPSGGGALVSSIASFLKQIDPSIKIIAVEPSSCQPFADSLRNNNIIASDTVSKFCHGSSVKKVGQWCFDIGKTSIDGFVNVTQKKLAQKIIKLYSMGFICEPSGALGVTALDKVKSEIKGKTVVCLITGANMELTKLEEAREMSMISKGYKNYYIVEVPNKKNSIYDLITKCFQVNDMISIQYNRKINKEASQALLAVESPTQENVENSIELMKEMNYKFEIINDRGQLLDLFF